ncbi:hypothetical protein HZC31_05865 [Candidatus Woesearchaeota archaeon]|nr:hypothetical protein [Candidatus Woesearchaeota archaeon]
MAQQNQTIIHKGDLATIVTYENDADNVYKFAKSRMGISPAALNNERAAYDFIESTLGTSGSESVILSVDTAVIDPDSQKPAIKIQKINPDQTLEGVLCTELGVSYKIAEADNVEKKKRFTKISENLTLKAENKGKHGGYTTDDVMMRVGVFSALLDKSDLFDGKFSQNDFDPSNILVRVDNEHGYDIRLFDFNYAIRTSLTKDTSGEIGHFKDLSGLSTERQNDSSYKHANKIESNSNWAYPSLLEEGTLETIFKAGAEINAPPINSSDVLRHSDLYQAAGLLYWSFTGKTLHEAGNDSVSFAQILPEEQSSLAEIADGLLAEAKKPLGRYDKARVASLRKELKDIISSYVDKNREETMARTATVVASPSGLAERLETLRDEISAVLPSALGQAGLNHAHYEAGSAALATTLQTYKAGLREEVSRLRDNNGRLEAALRKYSTYAKLAGVGIGFAGTLAAVLCVGAYFYGKSQAVISEKECPAVDCSSAAIDAVPSDAKPLVSEAFLKELCGDIPSDESYESCLWDLERTAGRQEYIADEYYSRLLDGCKTELDGYKAAGNRTVYVPRADPKLVEELEVTKEQLADERRRVESAKEENSGLTRESVSYKDKYFRAKYTIEKQWMECKVSAFAAPKWYLVCLDDENDKACLSEFCLATDRMIVARGIEYQEEVDSLSHDLTIDEKLMLVLDNYHRCSGYEKLPHDPLGPWKE